MIYENDSLIKFDGKSSGNSGGKRRRYRNWVGVLYPDSSPVDWLERLKALRVKAFVSPLHDRDLKNDDGEVKKPHYHILLMYDSVKSELQVVEDFTSFGAVPYLVQYVHSLSGMARYLCHLDDSDKYRYSADEVLELSGADYAKVALSSEKKSKVSVMNEIMRYIVETGEWSYYELVRYAMDEKPDWCEVLYGSGCNAVIAFMKSMVYTKEIKGSED